MVAGHRVPGEQAAAVVADHGDVVEAEQVDDAPDVLDLLIDRQGVSAVNRLEPAPGKSITWQVTCSLR